MMRRALTVRSILVSSFVLALALTLRPYGAEENNKKKWYKGNLHCHTLNGSPRPDADSTPNEVATWYRDHDYHFVVISDHNFLTDVRGLNAIHAAKEKFLIIPGEEVTDRFETKEIHLNAYNPSAQIEPQGGMSPSDVIQRNVNAIRAAKGLPALNHPNYTWAVTSKDLLAIQNLVLFEVFNGGPNVNNFGGGGYASHEELWDALLSAGKKFYGVAVDDAHEFKSYGQRLPFPLTPPGTGWVMVRAAELTTDNILTSLAIGDFYATTGVILDDVQASSSEIRIEIRELKPPRNPYHDNRHTTYFIGEGGKILAKSVEPLAVYKLTGREKYVRAKIQDANGRIAWTQPIFSSK